MREYKNRYGDVFTFKKDDDHNILWEGNFEYSRWGITENNGIDMVDPSGGPYLSVGMSMDSLGFEGYKIEDFKKIDTGYKIITEKCPLCHQAGGAHKMSCSTQKIQINL
jgi:hypothetical protein